MWYPCFTKTGGCHWRWLCIQHSTKLSKALYKYVEFYQQYAYVVSALLFERGIFPLVYLYGNWHDGPSRSFR
jgi:hypothetical protein